MDRFLILLYNTFKSSELEIITVPGRHVRLAVLTVTRQRWDADLISIPYDVDGLLQDFTTGGLDEYGMILYRNVKTMVSGVNYFYRSILEASRFCGLPLGQIP